MNEQELLDLINNIIKAAKPMDSEEIVLTSLDIPIKDTGLDSLDCIMINIFLGEMFGVSSETIGEMQLGPESKMSDMINFMLEHKTKQPATLAEALENIK
jgi:acyl carrier protein